MILIIDNYDSFTYNLYQYLGELGQDLLVVRNDKIDLKGIEDIAPDRIVISPGPCTPNEAGISTEVVRHFGPHTPILGVCLGHQCIGVAYGAKVKSAGEIVHGKTSAIKHDGYGVFSNLPNPIEGIRYHSLAIPMDSIPDELEATAFTDGGIVMGIRHRVYPVEGVQFHPESIMTQNGKMLLQNFLNK